MHAHWVFVYNLVKLIYRWYIYSSVFTVKLFTREMTSEENVFVFPADDIEHEALLTSDWAAHVTRLHADSDLGFSQEYEVLFIDFIVLFRK